MKNGTVPLDSRRGICHAILVQFPVLQKTQGEIMRKKDFVFFGNVRKDTKIGPACLSQSDRHAFVIDGVYYRHVAQFMMAAKALFFHDDAAYNKIMDATSLVDMKRAERAERRIQAQAASEGRRVRTCVVRRADGQFSWGAWRGVSGGDSESRRRCEMRCQDAANRKIACLPEFLFVKGMTHEHT